MVVVNACVNINQLMKLNVMFDHSYTSASMDSHLANPPSFRLVTPHNTILMVLYHFSSLV